MKRYFSSSYPLLLSLAAAGYIGATGCASDPVETPGDGDGSASGGGTGETIDGSNLGINLGDDNIQTMETMNSDGSRIRPANLPPAFTYTDPSGNPAFKDSSLGDDVGTLFDGAAGAGVAPAVVYPLNESMHPINVVQMNVQWSQGDASNTIFRMELSGADSEGMQKTYYFYVPCSETQCSYEMPDGEWWDMADAHLGSNLTLTIAGTDASGASVTRSAPVNLHFTPREVNGAVYYWAANQSVLKRAAMGAASAVDFIGSSQPGDPEPDPTNQFECVGCHSVSRDGAVIAFAVDTLQGHGRFGGIQVAPTADPTNPIIEPGCCDSPYVDAPAGRKNPEDQFGAYVALSPDGQLAAISGVSPDPENPGHPGNIHVTMRRVGGADAGTNLQIYPHTDPVFYQSDSVPQNGLIAFMEFSPSGDRIIATRQPSHSGWADAGNTRLVTMDVNKQTGELSNIKTIVEAQPEWTHYYPTWSPDGQWVAFASAPNAGAPDAYRNANGNQQAVLRLVRVADASDSPITCPGPSCYELEAATQYSVADSTALMGKHTTWPKFTPFSQGSLMFLSFTSKIDYGFVTQGSTQIWMAAIDTSKVGMGDPSFAPIWLPYQAEDDSSFSPYWTETLPCTSEGGTCSGCVGDEVCIVGSDEQTGDKTCECRVSVVR